MERRFQIIGTGLGVAAQLTVEAQQAIMRAGAVFATARLAEGLQTLRSDICVCAIGELGKLARASSASTAALLVSGDVGFFSAARQLSRQLSPYGEVELLCGLSSMQYFCARLNIPYDDALPVSLHGRQGSLLGACSYHRKVFALTGGTHTAASLCAELEAAGLGALRVHFGENLGAPNARILSATAAEIARLSCHDLAVLLIENDAPADCTRPIFDCDLTRANVPMTKEEVRWVSVAKLCPQPGDIIYDIGAGTGAVTLELARKANRGMVYAVERKPEAVRLLAQNRAKLGGYNIKLIEACAPDGLDDLPAPDAVFIGGSGGNLREIFRVLIAKNPAVRIVVNAIALETLEEARAAWQECFGALPAVVQLTAARGKAVGRYTMMTANNPVFIISGGE